MNISRKRTHVFYSALVTVMLLFSTSGFTSVDCQKAWYVGVYDSCADVDTQFCNAGVPVRIQKDAADPTQYYCSYSNGECTGGGSCKAGTCTQGTNDPLC